MAATPEEIRSGVGLRHVQVLALNATGYPAGTQQTTAYQGVTVSGAVSFGLEDPEPQQIVHRGDDRVFALDVLPPTEPISGELTVSKTNDDIDAVLTDDNIVTIGQTKFFGLGTDNRGDENQVCVLAFQQSVDTDPASTDFGARRWGSRLIPKCYVIPRATGFEQDTPTNRGYTVRPLFVKKYPWGEAFTTGTEGFEQGQMLRGISQYKPKIIAFAGGSNAAEVRTNFPSGFPAATTDKIKCWIDGTVSTAESIETSGMTWTTAAGATTGAMLVVFYEYE